MNNIEYNLLMTIGLSVNINNDLVDEYGQALSLNGKPIKAPCNGVLSPINKYDEILYEPLTNVVLMRQLFQYYVSMRSEEDGISYPVFYPIFSEMIKNKAKVVIKRDDGVLFESKFYFNECVRYIDLIFIMEENESDFTSIDSMPVY